MVALSVSIFLASVLGSLHCVGMCGGLVAVYAVKGHAEQRVSWGPHLLYHAGRLLSYVALGATVGALGAVVDFAGAMVAITHLAAWLAGALMVAIGVVSIAQLSGWRRLQLPALTRLTRLQMAMIRRLRERSPVVRAGFLGVLSALLPCGWLYAFVVTAAATASPLKGALLMCAFWLGTVPALLGLGLALNALSLTIRRAVPWVAAVSILCIGLLTIWFRTQLPVPWVKARDTVAHVIGPDVVKPPKEPFCHGH